MMLTPEQLVEIRHLLQEDGNRHDGAIVTYPRSLYTMRDMLAHIDAQQARIAELESAWQAQTLNRKDQVIEQQERHNDELKARIAELEAQLNAAILARREAQQAEQAAIEARNRAGVEIRRPLMERIRELEQDAANAAAAERERIKAICGDVIDEWFNCAGGADEVLRRIEESEQKGCAAC